MPVYRVSRAQVDSSCCSRLSSFFKAFSLLQTYSQLSSKFQPFLPILFLLMGCSTVVSICSKITCHANTFTMQTGCQLFAKTDVFHTNPVQSVPEFWDNRNHFDYQNHRECHPWNPTRAKSGDQVDILD